MQQSNFITHKNELIKILGQLFAPSRRYRKLINTTICEVTVLNNKVIFYTPGSTVELECSTQGSVKMAIGYHYFKDIVSSQKDPILQILITDGEMKIGKLKIPVKTTFFEDDTILRSIDIPVNPTPQDLLDLSSGHYTPEEIAFNQMQDAEREGKIRLKDAIQKAFDLLKVYKVKRKDIEELVEKSQKKE